MVVILVNWIIKKDCADQFVKRWKEMNPKSKKGFLGEILTTVDADPQDPMFHTFSLGDPFYSTFINVGLWESVQHFDDAIRPMMPTSELVKKEDGTVVYSIELEHFEFKLRERIVLAVISQRPGETGESVSDALARKASQSS